MKNFLSVKKFKELKVLFVIEIVFYFLLFTIISIENIQVSYWNLNAFLISLGIWLISSAIDKKNYWNLATLLATGLFTYIIWWFTFTVLSQQ